MRMTVTITGCGRTLVCPTGGFCAEWEDGTCDSGCDPVDETALPTPLAQGGRRLKRLTVRRMRRGALRLVLGGADAEAPQDDERIDLTLEDVTVAAVLAAIDR
jgi:hypothetical protein